jgi:hypothetical protein
VKHLVIGLLLGVSTPSFAEELQYVPKWKMVGQKACYEFAQASKLFEIDKQLAAFIAAAPIRDELEDELRKAAKKYKDALELEEAAAAKLKKQNEKLAADLMKETARANKESAKPGPFPAWTVGAGVGLAVGVVAGVVLGVYVAK